MTGRPSKYQPGFAEQAAKLCKLGATDAEMADFFDVSVSTLNLWKVQHDDFSASIKDAKAVADERVERSLYERAMGYEHDEIDIRVVNGEIVMTPIRKKYAPDTVAAIFWLKNRKAANWRDIKAVELSGKDGGPIRHAAEYTDDELAAIAAGRRAPDA